MSNTNTYDSSLLIGFGGPTPGCCKKHDPCPGEAYCFVEKIVGTAPSSAERVREVVGHYVALGGFSPFNELTFQQASALEATLKERGIDVPIYVGMRNWTPYLHETIAKMQTAGHRNILGVIMSAYQSKASWERYQQDVSNAIEALDSRPLTVSYLDATWYLHTGFTNAIADRIHTACEDLTGDRFDKASLVFTAHAIPLPAAKSSLYVQQFRRTAAAVSDLLGRDFDIAYQSSPSNPRVPWTGPDINDLIREKNGAGVKNIIASPIGFLCDHIEVLYDLDVEAKATAEACGMGFARARTVGNHSEFIGVLADFVGERFNT